MSSMGAKAPRSAQVSQIDALMPTLLSGLQDLCLVLSEAQCLKILTYLELLVKWSGTYNLTAVKEPKDMLVQHILDCLSIINPLIRKCRDTQIDYRGARLLDVGSGAGLPAVMIAVACPDTEVLAVDAVGKKVAFIQQVALELGLRQLSAQHTRVEAITCASYDVVTCRAYSSLSDFVSTTKRAINEAGVWLAMKGHAPSEKELDLPAGVGVLAVESVQVPGLNAQRCLVWMRREGPHPNQAGAP